MDRELQPYKDPGDPRSETRMKIRTYYLSLNMRQIWDLTKVYKNALDSGIRAPDDEPRHSLEMDVYQKGMIYYTAKKHGLGAAILWKLSNI